jgi:hypothetical protein
MYCASDVDGDGMDADIFWIEGVRGELLLFFVCSAIFRVTVKRRG